MSMGDHQYINMSSKVEDEGSSEMSVVEDLMGTDEYLIRVVRSYPHLYDHSTQDFKNVLMRENSWMEVASITGKLASECQARWIRLREKFGRERRTREIEARTGNRTRHRVGFSLYNSMRFLESHYKSRQINKKQRVPLLGSHSACSSVPTVINTPPVSPEPITSSKSKLEKSVALLCQAMRHRFTSHEDSFGQFVGSKLSEFPKEERKRREEDILKILYAPYKS